MLIRSGFVIIYCFIIIINIKSCIEIKNCQRGGRDGRNISVAGFFELNFKNKKASSEISNGDHSIKMYENEILRLSVHDPV